MTATKKNNFVMEDEFFEIIKSVKKIGTKKALDVLKNAQAESVNYSVLINLTITTIIKEWGNKFKKEDLFEPNIRGEVVLARNTIIIVTNKLTMLEPRKLYDSICSEINIRHGKFNVRSIRRVLCEFRELDDKNKFDKVTIDRTEKIVEIVMSGMNTKTKNKK